MTKNVEKEKISHKNRFITNNLYKKHRFINIFVIIKSPKIKSW